MFLVCFFLPLCCQHRDLLIEVNRHAEARNDFPFCRCMALFNVACGLMAASHDNHGVHSHSICSIISGSFPTSAQPYDGLSCVLCLSQKGPSETTISISRLSPSPPRLRGARSLLGGTYDESVPSGAYCCCSAGPSNAGFKRALNGRA